MSRFTIVLIVTIGLGACASQQPPAWVINPQMDGGFAATECVADNGNLSLDRQIAVARARAEIAKQIELRVAAMDKTYARITEEQPAPGDDGKATTRARTVQTAFESVSKQIAEQTLSGLAPQRVEYVEYGGRRELCAMLTLEKPGTQQVFDQIVQASGAPVSAPARDALYRDFTAAAGN